MAGTSLSLKTPGVYIEEIQTLPPSIAAVETAIPAFIGYTEKAVNEDGQDIPNEPYRIRSMLDYVRFFGNPDVEKNIKVTIDAAGNIFGSNEGQLPYMMHYALQIFFANGGGECFIVSVGDYSEGTVDKSKLKTGLDATEKIDDITLYVFPDAQGLDTIDDYYGIYNDAILLCKKLQDRFTVMDVFDDDIDGLRDKTLSQVDEIKYSAAYYPNLRTTLDLYYGGEGNGDENVEVIDNSGAGLSGTLKELLDKKANATYHRARAAIRSIPTELPPSPAIVGIYARVDASRGVWKAPANVSLNAVIEPVTLVTDAEQESLNVDTTAGKSVNVIRSFKGRGILVWGARTLAGNDNEWRYVSVRRFFNMVEESAKKATFQFVFEPNDINTWTRVKSMIENFLTQQWRAGALQGATPEQAFFVHVGLGETMTAIDVLEGRMIVEIGMAVVRPAEFIVLQFMHKLPEA